MERVKGSILIVSLWMLAILSLLAITFAHKAAVELRLTGYQWDETRLLQDAKMGVSLAGWALKRPGQTASFGALNQPWSQDPAFFKDHPVPGGFITFSHRAGDETLYGLEDEAGRLNINKAPLEVLERLFASSPGVAEAVDAWRTPVPTETADEKQEFGPRKGPFQSVEELLLVKGMTPALFHEVKDLITVDGDGRVNLNTASPAVLGAVGLEPSLTVKISRFRKGEDGKEGTEDDGVFPTAASAPSLLGEVFDLSVEESASLSNVLAKNLLTARPGPLRLNLLARLSEGSSRAFTIVVPAGAPAGTILHWHEGPA